MKHFVHHLAKRRAGAGFDGDGRARQLAGVRIGSLAALLLTLGAAAPARAQVERALTTLEAVHEACRDARREPGRHVFAVEVEPTWSFGTLDQDGFLAIEPRRNFRALGGRVELFPARMERIGLVATPSRLDELEAARARGARLRIGFFLGFDDPDRTACLIRSRHAVTMVRMDVAFVELLAADGSMIAREDGERYRAWLDDRQRDAVPGSGPRAALGEPSTRSGPLPDAWRRAFADAAQGELGRALRDCHQQAIERGAEPHGRVVVRLRVDGRTGRVLESAAALSDLGDTHAAECMARVLRALALPAGPGEWGARIVDVELPIRVAAD